MTRLVVDGRQPAHRRAASIAEVCLFCLASIQVGENSACANALLFLFIALSPIDDLFLQGTTLRGLGASLSIFPLCGLALLGAARWLVRAEDRLSSILPICVLYVLLTAVYGLLLFGTWSQGENLLWRGFTSVVSLSAVAFAAFQSYRQTSVLRIAVYIAFGLLIVGFAFGNSSPFGFPSLAENGFLHFTALADFRPRGLSSEPSEFSVTAMAIGFLAAYVTRSRIMKISFSSLTLGLLIASGSKGGILVLLICAVALGVIYWHSRWYKVIGLVLVGLPMGLFAIWLIPSLFPLASFAISETIPTRVSMIICSLMVFIHNPFGVGVTGFLPSVAEYLPRAMSSLESVSPLPLSFNEVASYVTSADMVGTKTFFFDQLIRFGFPFAICFFVYIAGILRALIAQKQIILLIVVLACSIALVTYVPGTNNFAVPIVFGVASSEANRASAPRCCK